MAAADGGASRVARARELAVATGSAAAAVLAGHAALNAALLRRPPATASVSERVSILLPVRNEAHRVEPCLRSLLGQTDLADAEILVLDDDSTDGTADVVRRVAGDRVRLLAADRLPQGWLGKPHACQELADAASGSVLVFVDADVVLAPDAVARVVRLLRDTALDLVSPYPRQVAVSAAERLVQPLLQWSWLTFLPLRLAERSRRPSLAAANGQLLVVDTAAYRAAGGHTAVRRQVLDDVALVRAFKRAGRRGGVVDGTALATCRMYDGRAALVEGYTKSLAAAFPSRPRSLAVAALLGWLYLLPPLAALRGSRAGAAGFGAAVAGRVVTARVTGGRAAPDALAHPASVAAVLGLLAASWRRRRAGTATWKGRRVA